MADTDTIDGEKILIQIGDGASPEVFAHPCLINQDRAFNRTATTVTEIITDCQDPSAPGWQKTEIDGLSAGIDGGGILDVASVAMFDTWFESGATKNVKVKLNKTGGRTYTGAYKLTAFNVTGTRKNVAKCTITLMSTGKVLSAANA